MVKDTKSGSTRRKRRNLKQSINALLALPINSQHIKFLKRLGVDEKDADNNMLVAAFLFVRALRGDVAAYKLLMEYGGLSPSEKRLEKKTSAEIAYLKAKTAAAGASIGGDVKDDEKDDVIIYIPDNGRDNGLWQGAAG